jgi:hypothetical protein
MEQNSTMSEAPLMPAPKTPKDNTDRDIARLVNAGLMPRNKLPLLRAARKNLARRGDIAMIPRMQRRAIQDYQDALQTAALKTTGSVSAVRRNINAGVELEGDVINEEVFSAPQMLVLRRTGIRIFPDGRRVALYVNDRHNLMFSVPYKKTLGPSNIPMVQAEEVEHIEENIEHIKNISRKGQSKEIKFTDGTSHNVDVETAKAIHLVHDALNDENKTKVAKMLSHSAGQFKKVASFAHKNVGYRIGKQS